MCEKLKKKQNKKPDCISCPDAPPKTDSLSDYLMAFSRKAMLGRDGTGGIDYKFVYFMAERESEDINMQDILADFISKVDGIGKKWLNRK